MSDSTSSETPDTKQEDPVFSASAGEVKDNKGEVVAKYSGDELTIRRGYGRYKDAIEKAVEASDGIDVVGDAKTTDLPLVPANPAPARSVAPAPVAQPTAPQKSARVAKVLAEREEKPDGVIEEGRIQSAKFKDDVADDLTFAKRNNCPEPPKKNPKFGDKTPAYVDWLKTYRHDKYLAKYGVEREAQKVPVYDDAGNVLRHETMDIASRKVHTTEKIERDPALEESMDWNA